jgi:beta-lactam-binding protein with PASTA domain
VPRAALAFVGLVGLWFIALGAYQAYRAGMFALPAQHARTAGSAVTVHAPLLLGKTVSDAQRIAASQHLSVAVASGRQDPQTAAGSIVAQDPSANAGIAAGGTIHVVVSEGSGMVPSLRGLAVAAAQQALASAGLRSGATRYTHDDTVAAGMIVDQSPAASAHVPAGAAVDLVISQGPATASPSADSAIVPTVTGMPLSQAESQLRAAGLRAGQVSYAYDDKAAAGIVIQQQKTAGTHASANDAVDMVVSRGRQPEPAQTPPSQPAPPTKPPSPPAPNPPPQTPPAPPAPNPPSQQFPAPPQPPPSDQPPAPPQNAPPDNPPTQTTP